MLPCDAPESRFETSREALQSSLQFQPNSQTLTAGFLVIPVKPIRKETRAMLRSAAPAAWAATVDIFILGCRSAEPAMRTHTEKRLPHMWYVFKELKNTCTWLLEHSTFPSP
eukprot:1145210-Pelagomonas_calceolata.AAC.3